VKRRDNGDAHLKRQIMGREVVVAITDGRLDDSAEPQAEGSSKSLVRGSRSFTVSLAVGAESACWSRSLENRSH